MLYLTVAALVLLVVGAVMVKMTKLTGLGIILAILGAVSAILLGGNIIREDTSKSAKCASLDGKYGGGACYVQGVEKDLTNIENEVKKL